MYRGLFQEFVDGKKYPLAVTSQVPLLVEEMISGQALTCDGFVYRRQTNPAPSALAYLVQNKCVKSLLWLVKRSLPI